MSPAAPRHRDTRRPDVGPKAIHSSDHDLNVGMTSLLTTTLHSTTMLFARAFNVSRSGARGYASARVAEVVKPKADDVVITVSKPTAPGGLFDCGC